MNYKKQRRLRNFLITLAVICLTPLAEKGRVLSGARKTDAFLGKEIDCAIDLGNDMYGGHGLETGLNYELLQQFAKENHCSINIKVAGNKENYLDSLKQGKVDMVITHDMDPIETDSINVLKQITDCSIWVINSSEEQEIRQMNNWLSFIASSEGYKKMQIRYQSLLNPRKVQENGIKRSRLSPYDDMIRQHADELGWDWRMLAALIYQESRFSISSKSFRGATGLMQIMPQTGLYYGVTDLVNPEQNLRAGTSHLKRLQNMLKGQGIENEELIKFTLAAYNAGEGRIADCRNFAASRQTDNMSWDSIVSIIPLMREDSILNEPSVKYGKFQGFETISYVESIMSLYNTFCTICPA